MGRQALADYAIRIMERETGIEPATNSLEVRQPFDYVGLSKLPSIPQALLTSIEFPVFGAPLNGICGTVVRAFLHPRPSGLERASAARPLPRVPGKLGLMYLPHLTDFPTRQILESG